MEDLKVSVIIPTYRGADYLGEAIQSVLDQTYANFELIIVDDASPDNTAEVVGRFNDPRIKYLVHEVNKGVDPARLLAFRSSTGDVIALLDQDDLYHPEKLSAHVALLSNNPQIGFTYNSRFELNHSATTVREIWRPPQHPTLADLVLGFPISPSDMVLRRAWLPYLDMSWEPPLIHGGEYVITGRLYMSGCNFASIDRALNYRRYHSGRTYTRLAARCESELSAQQRVFADSRCPPDVLKLRDEAFSNTYRIWAYYALAQEETTLGQEYLRQAVRLKPSLLNGTPCELVNFFMIFSIDDENKDHGVLLQRIFNQLPPEMVQISAQYDWAVTRGYLLKGARAIIWDRLDDGRRHFARAAQLRARSDESLISQITQFLLNYGIEYGEESVQKKIHALAPSLEAIGGPAGIRELTSCYLVNHAFRRYHAREYTSVAADVLHAIANNPKYLANRGVLSIFFRSLISA